MTRATLSHGNTVGSYCTGPNHATGSKGFAVDRRLFVLALGMFALGTDSFVVAGVLPEISLHFRITIGAAGQMTTAYAITYALMAPLIAAVAAHIPRKVLLLSGLGIFVVATIIT